MRCFFFQAEDGIRDIGVTGVQTCALPISYTYDPNRPQRMLTRTDADGHTVTYGYDDVERVTSVKLPSTATYGFTYDDLGNRTAVTMPSGKTHTYGFSPTGDRTGYTAPGVGPLTRAYDDDH